MQQRRLAIFLALVSGLVASSASAATVLLGRNDPARDVPALQAAASRGGLVVLVGSFDVGDETILIARDVIFWGLRTPRGAYLNRVKNGLWTFHSMPPAATPLPPGPRITIRDLDLDGASGAPIEIAYASAVDVTGNRIRNVRPLVVPSVPPRLRATGIEVGTNTAFAASTFVPGALTGRVAIHDNDIDVPSEVNPSSPNDSLAQTLGINVNLAALTRVTISGNRVTNASRGAIEVIDVRRDASGEGTVTVSHNDIVTGAAGSRAPNPNAPNGIIIGWNYFPAGGRDPALNPDITCRANRIEMHAALLAQAILVLADGPLIEKNEIVMAGGALVRGIVQLASYGLIRNNRIEGHGESAIRVFENVGFLAEHNTFVGNKLMSFEPAPGSATVIFLATSNDNTFIGKAGSIINENPTNTIVTP